MTINLNTNIAANTVSQPLSGIKHRAAEKPALESPDKSVNPAQLPVKVKTDQQVIERLEADRNEQQHQAKLERPDRNTQKALTAYRDVALADRREEIHSLVGVDLFA